MNLLFNLIVLLSLVLLVNSAPSRDPYDTCSCGELGHFTKIVGGREAKPHSYPWTVAITGFPNEGNFFCGATIVSSRFLLTAGHCFETADPDYSFDKLRIKIGVHNLTEDEHVLTVRPKAVKIYEGFTTENDINAPLLDIALLELEEDLPVTPEIRPICVHSKYFNYHINELKEYRNFQMNQIKNFRKEDEVDDNRVSDRPNGLKPGKVIKNVARKTEQPTDKHKIILDHPDKELIRRVVQTVDRYYYQIRNDPKKIFDPAKEFTTDNLTVVGWGSVDRYDLTILPDVLMETEITQKKSGVCENSYGDDVFFRSKNICANDEGTDSCNGDSGGPLMTKKYGRMNLYGIVSYGRACGSYSSPGVYTRISAFLSWILLHTIDSKFCPN